MMRRTLTTLSLLLAVLATMVTVSSSAAAMAIPGGGSTPWGKPRHQPWICKFLNNSHPTTTTYATQATLRTTADEMPDLYPDYKTLAANEVYGQAYDIRSATGRPLDWASIAIHGGGIEGGTGEVAKAVSDNLMSYYEFRGLLPANNFDRLHVTSTNFDEPIAQGIVASSGRTLSFHGYVGTGVAQTSIGGLDETLKPAVAARLTAAGFSVITAAQEIGGADPDNIVNENRIKAGVQLEMSRALRESFFPGNTTSRSVRDSGARTPQFWAYVAAVRAAVQDVYGGFRRPKGKDLCAVEYTGRVTDRSGAVVADTVSLTDVEWNRILNGTSTATVTVSPEGDCCAQMGNVRTWGHTLTLYRNGVFVWSGPITGVSWGPDDVTIVANDISAWLSRRVPHANATYNNSDLTVIGKWLIDDGFAPDDPGHTVNIVGPANVKGGRSYLKNVGQTLDHLGDLADTGLDWTVVGTQFVLLPDDWSQSVGSLTDEDMPSGMTVAEDGAALTTRWVVAGGGDSTFVGEAGGTDTFYGLLEQYEEQSSVTDVTAATDAAKAKLASSKTAPVFIDTSSVTISPEAPVDVQSLIPGWSLDVATASTCRNIGQRLKITGVRVLMQSGDNDQGSEQIQVTVASGGFAFTELDSETAS